MKRCNNSFLRTVACKGVDDVIEVTWSEKLALICYFTSCQRFGRIDLCAYVRMRAMISSVSSDEKVNF